jgi:hypothetical protein
LIQTDESDPGDAMVRDPQATAGTRRYMRNLALWLAGRTGQRRRGRFSLSRHRIASQNCQIGGQPVWAIGYRVFLHAGQRMSLAQESLIR